MVAVDYSYRDSEYYTKWYKQGIVPGDNLFMGYQFITSALSTVGSIFGSMKSSGSEGGGGGGLNGTVKEDEGPSVTEQTEAKRTQKDFIKAYDAWAKDTTKEPGSELKKLAKKVGETGSIHSTMKEKADKVNTWKKSSD